MAEWPYGPQKPSPPGSPINKFCQKGASIKQALTAIHKKKKNNEQKSYMNAALENIPGLVKKENKIVTGIRQINLEVEKLCNIIKI